MNQSITIKTLILCLFMNSCAAQVGPTKKGIAIIAGCAALVTAIKMNSYIKELPDSAAYTKLVNGYQIPVPTANAEFVAVNTDQFKGLVISPPPAARDLTALCFKNPQPLIRALTLEKDNGKTVSVTTHIWPAHAHCNTACCITSKTAAQMDIAFISALSKAPTVRPDGWMKNKFLIFTQPASRKDFFHECFGFFNPTVNPVTQTSCSTAAGTYHVTLKTVEGVPSICVKLEPSYLMNRVQARRDGSQTNKPSE